MTEDEMVGWHHQLDGQSVSRLQELVMDREAWRPESMVLQRVRHDWATELTELIHEVDWWCSVVPDSFATP